MNERQGEVEVRVRYAETDQMGRAHHSHYVVWCELGRTTLMRARGVSYAELERRGVLLPVARVELEYRKGVGYDDRVRISTRVERVRSRSVVFGYRLTRAEDGALIAMGSTKLVCIDADGNPRRLPSEVQAALRSLVPEEPVS